MDFDLFSSSRGGTAPIVYGTNRSGRPNPEMKDSYRCCEQQHVDGDDDLTGLPRAPVPRNQRQEKTRHAQRGSTKNLGRGYRGARAGWGKRHNNNDCVGLNLALKYNTMQIRKKSGGGGGDGDLRPPPPVMSSNGEDQKHGWSGAGEIIRCKRLRWPFAAQFMNLSVSSE